MVFLILFRLSPSSLLPCLDLERYDRHAWLTLQSSVAKRHKHPTLKTGLRIRLYLGTAPVLHLGFLLALRASFGQDECPDTGKAGRYPQAQSSDSPIRYLTRESRLHCVACLAIARGIHGVYRQRSRIPIVLESKGCTSPNY